MDTVKARSAVGLALAIGLALPSCTNTEGPQVSSTPRATTADTRAANDDPAATEAALERFIGMDASDAKRKLLRQHFEFDSDLQSRWASGTTSAVIRHIPMWSSRVLNSGQVR